jgi:hypothetical protein
MGIALLNPSYACWFGAAVFTGIAADYLLR